MKYESHFYLTRVVISHLEVGVLNFIQGYYF